MHKMNMSFNELKSKQTFTILYDWNESVFLNLQNPLIPEYVLC